MAAPHRRCSLRRLGGKAAGPAVRVPVVSLDVSALEAPPSLAVSGDTSEPALNGAAATDGGDPGAGAGHPAATSEGTTTAVGSPKARRSRVHSADTPRSSVRRRKSSTHTPSRRQSEPVSRAYRSPRRSQAESQLRWRASWVAVLGIDPQELARLEGRQPKRRRSTRAMSVEPLGSARRSQQAQKRRQSRSTPDGGVQTRRGRSKPDTSGRSPASGAVVNTGKAVKKQRKAPRPRPKSSSVPPASRRRRRRRKGPGQRRSVKGRRDDVGVGASNPGGDTNSVSSDGGDVPNASSDVGVGPWNSPPSPAADPRPPLPAFGQPILSLDGTSMIFPPPPHMLKPELLPTPAPVSGVAMRWVHALSFLHVVWWCVASTLLVRQFPQPTTPQTALTPPPPPPPDVEPPPPPDEVGEATAPTQPHLPLFTATGDATPTNGSPASDMWAQSPRSSHSPHPSAPRTQSPLAAGTPSSRGGRQARRQGVPTRGGAATPRGKGAGGASQVWLVTKDSEAFLSAPPARVSPSPDTDSSGTGGGRDGGGRDGGAARGDRVGPGLQSLLDLADSPVHGAQPQPQPLHTGASAGSLGSRQPLRFTLGDMLPTTTAADQPPSPADSNTTSPREETESPGQADRGVGAAGGAATADSPAVTPRAGDASAGGVASPVVAPTSAKATAVTPASTAARRARRVRRGKPRTFVLDAKVATQLRGKLRAAAYTAGGVDWHRLFQRQDRDQSGCLDFEEFHATVRRRGGMSADMLNDADLLRLFCDVDSDGSGSVDVLELVRWIMGDSADAQREVERVQRTRPATPPDRSQGRRRRPRAQAPGASSPRSLASASTDSDAEERRDTLPPLRTETVAQLRFRARRASSRQLLTASNGSDVGCDDDDDGASSPAAAAPSGSPTDATMRAWLHLLFFMRARGIETLGWQDFHRRVRDVAGIREQDLPQRDLMWMFCLCDRDLDGRVSANELARFLGVPPDVFDFNLHASGGALSPAVDSPHASPSPAAATAPAVASAPMAATTPPVAAGEVATASHKQQQQHTTTPLRVSSSRDGSPIGFLPDVPTPRQVARQRGEPVAWPSEEPLDEATNDVQPPVVADDGALGPTELGGFADGVEPFVPGSPRSEGMSSTTTDSVNGTGSLYSSSVDSLGDRESPAGSPVHVPRVGSGDMHSRPIVEVNSGISLGEEAGRVWPRSAQQPRCVASSLGPWHSQSCAGDDLTRLYVVMLLVCVSVCLFACSCVQLQRCGDATQADVCHSPSQHACSAAHWTLGHANSHPSAGTLTARRASLLDCRSPSPRHHREALARRGQA